MAGGSVGPGGEPERLVPTGGSPPLSVASAAAFLPVVGEGVRVAVSRDGDELADVKLGGGVKLPLALPPWRISETELLVLSAAAEERLCELGRGAPAAKPRVPGEWDSQCAGCCCDGATTGSRLEELEPPNLNLRNHLGKALPLQIQFKFQSDKSFR